MLAAVCGCVSWALYEGFKLGRQAAWRPRCNRGGVVKKVDGTVYSAPIITVVIGEGSSVGALGIAMGNCVYSAPIITVVIGEGSSVGVLGIIMGILLVCFTGLLWSHLIRGCSFCSSWQVVKHTPGVANRLADILSRRFQPGVQFVVPQVFCWCA